MRRYATRRWLTGLGVLGTFVVAPAAPAPAAPGGPPAVGEAVTQSGVETSANDVTVAPGGTGRTVTLRALGEVSPGEYTITVDFGAVDAFVEVRDPAATDCTRAGTVLTCTAFDEDAPDLLALPVLARRDAEVGRHGGIRFTVTTPRGGTGTAESAVRVGEGVDLVAGPRVALSGRPGSTLPMVLSVGNRGQQTVQGAVLLVSAAYGLTPSQRYRNCRYSSVGGPEHFLPNLFACTFDDPIAPGRALRVGAGFGVTVPRDAWAPNTQNGTATWFTPQDWADVRHRYPLDRQGTGGVLRLEPAALPTGASRTPQTDVDPADNTTTIGLAVTGDQRADLAADEVRVTARVGATVPVTVGYTNRGPASSSNGGQSFFTIVRMTVPTGVTAVRAPANCTDADGPHEEYGQPGARAYECYQYDVIPRGGRVALPFSFRIDRAGTLTGRVELYHGSTGLADLDPRNDTAKILVNAGSGGQGGADGTLPITGSPTGLLASVGGLLLLAGVGSYLVARHRRARFVA
ncbi:cell wall anchor protein [Micromonospora sp. HUAS LYJ1]|uniref:cell wall anchor protein n=1 Tax=Micromonospora sp. HUAS LYJ1 TaxID=3061626 RepID=UPI0026728D5A|nr:cell wall anchor protein [Micromonospora sp. HUAS LYJ1]WKU03090.1 cell wall anchor protein [Micromonospora sp. HUAS LYJ1]